jgi:Family of unknown function (DUF5947)
MPQMQYSPFTSLQNLVRQRDTRERCDLCGTAISSVHQHLIEPAARRLVCACDACALLFDSATTTKYRRVPRDVRALINFQMTDAEWDGLHIPIGVAFFFKSSVQNSTLAIYPSPAGATESLLSLDAWQEIVDRNPALARMQPDVEALLINRLDLAKHPAEYYLVPIDKCYELVGLLRSHWRGLSGGSEVWSQIRRFFDELRMQAGQASRPQVEFSHA